MRAVVGHCEDIDTVDAIASVLEMCRKDLAGLVPQAGLVIASSLHDFDTITSAVMDAFPDLELIGCSTNGELSSVLGYAEDSVALMLFHSDFIEMKAGIGKGASVKPQDAAREAIQMALDSMNGRPGLCITLPEIWQASTRDVVDGIEEALEFAVPVFGGASFNEEMTGPTVQCYKREVLTDSIPVLLFSGPIQVSGAAESGWTPIGKKHRVTGADGNVVRTIDDRPAEDLFIQYFGGHSMFYPVAVFPVEDGPFFIATPALVVEDGGIFFLNHIPRDSIVQFTDATAEDIIGAARTSSAEAADHFPGEKPAVGLIFSCAGRRASLGTRTAEEVELLRSQLGHDVPLLGFYSGGEICPLRGQEKTQTHGFTFTTVLIGEG